MNQAYSDNGIVLKTLDFGEADKLIGIQTENHGYQDFIAKGARRMNSKKAPHLDLFNQIRFQIIRGHSPQMIDQASTTNYFPKIKEDLNKVKLCLSIAEIITNLSAPNQEDRELYLSLANLLHAVEKKDIIQSAKVVSDFNKYLLRHLGYPPIPNGNTSISDYMETIINRRLVSNQIV